MGWTYSSAWRRPTDVVQDLLAPGHWGPGWTTLDHALTGVARRLWVLAEAPDGTCFITLFLIERQDGEYGYKDLDETMGPVYYDCPLRLVNRTQPPDPEALSWRAKVRAYHRRRTRHYEPGDQVTVRGQPATVVGRYRRSYEVVRRADGRHFRATPLHMEPTAPAT